MTLTSLIQIARENGCTITEQASMSAATTFKVGGPADLLVDIPTSEAAAAVIGCCARENIPWMMIGNGSNLLVGDKGIRGAVLRLEGRDAAPELKEDGRVYAPAGISLQRLCLFARDHCLSGLEFAYGIPGSVGGAVYMNGGAYDGCMADVVVEAYCLTADGKALTLSADDLNMSYRHTALMERNLT